jgi:hypothetical protein
LGLTDGCGTCEPYTNKEKRGKLPTLVILVYVVCRIATSYLHVLALTNSGGVLFWDESQLSQGVIPPEATSGIVGIAAGDSHSMALMSSGRVLVWGGLSGQSNVPAQAQSGVIKIDAGTCSCLALRSDGRVIAWVQYVAGYFSPSQPISPDVRAVPITPSGIDSGVRICS